MMKYAVFISIFLLLSTGQAQEENSAFTLTPVQPKLGDAITLTYYNNSPSATLKDVVEITCQALVGRNEADPLLIEVPLKNEGGVWHGILTIDDKDASLVVFKLVSDDKNDDNDGNPWYTIIYGSDNTPVKGAHLAAGHLLFSGRLHSFRHKPDLNKAKFHFEQEKTLYPDQWRATTALWDVRLKEDPSPESKGALKTEIMSFYDARKSDEKAVSGAIYWWEKVGDSAKADEVRKSEIEKNPKGLIAQETRSSAIWKEEDKKKRIELLRALLADFPSMDKKAQQMYLQNLFYLQLRNDEMDAAADVLEKIEKPAVSMYNEIAWRFIEKGNDLEKAVGWAKKGVDIVRNPDPSDKPSYMSVKDWTENNKYYSNMVLDTYGYGLLKLGRLQEAEKILEEVFTSSKGEDPESNLHYIEVLDQAGKFGKVIEVGMEMIANGKDSPEIIDGLKAAYAKNSERNTKYEDLSEDKKQKFDDMLAETMKIKIERIQKALKETRLNTPGIDFTLKDINGVPVSLSGLKGKVVILDFWATWCGPCKSSFPYLQKVYEKYQNNDNVKILAINSWERQKDYPAQLENAVSFMQKNNYTFPVLLDEKKEDQFIVIGQYEVEGIPTKFVLDKNGAIVWKVVGFDNGQFMIDEMTQQIEMLLNE